MFVPTLQAKNNKKMCNLNISKKASASVWSVSGNLWSHMMQNNYGDIGGAP